MRRKFYGMMMQARHEGRYAGHSHGPADDEFSFSSQGRGHGSGSGGSGRGGNGRGGRSGGRRRLFDNETLRLLFLHLTSQEPRHGYEMIRAIEELSGGVYVPSPGMVYPAISLLTEMEYIAEQPSEGARKRYAITPTGQAFLGEHEKQRDAALARLAELSQRAAPSAVDAPIFRAMDGLKTALRFRLGREDMNADIILDIAALIDEATTKIERLK